MQALTVERLLATMKMIAMDRRRAKKEKNLWQDDSLEK